MPLSYASLAEAIDIPAWLEQDRQTSWDKRIERDQNISKLADIPPQQASRRVRHWWDEIKPNSGTNSSGSALTTIFKRVSWSVILLGFISGILLAGALLNYDGSQPINVLVLLVILVLVPLGLFLVSLLLPLWSSNSLISGLNPGGMVFNFFKNKSTPLSDFFSSSRSEQAKDKLLRWKLLLCSQQFGIALSLAALLTLLVRVSFSDLAFGWSTTLDIHYSSLAPWIQAISWPWSAWFPEAVPSNSLIEQSRFYRLENGLSELSAQTLTGWWKFIAMCILVYGIGLRLFAAWVASINYKLAVENMLMQHSEVNALLDRFSCPDNLHESVPVVKANNTSLNVSDSNISSADLVIRWNSAELVGSSQLEKVIELTPDDTVQLDSDVFKDFDLNSIKKIHIITKSWEPPLLEFHDLILVLREKFGAMVSISIQPIAAREHSLESVDVEIWRHSIEKLQDPKVYVV